MSTPILAPTINTVKELTGDDLWSDNLATKLKASKLSSLSLPTNLTAQAFLLAHLPPTNLAGGVVWCLPNHRDLNEALDLANFWLSTLANRLPHKPGLFVFPHDFIAWLQANRLNHSAILLIAAEHLTLALPSAQEIKQHTIELKINDLIKPLALINNLLAAGYEPGPLPDNVGWYQKKGGNLIIATTNGSWRLVWDDNRLEKMERFSTESGLVIESVPQVTIMPHNLTPRLGENISSYILKQHTLIGSPANFLPTHQQRLLVKPTLKPTLFGGVPFFAKQWTELARWLQTKNDAREKVIILTPSPYRLLNSIPPNQAQALEIPTTISSHLTGFANNCEKTFYLTEREIFGVSRSFQRRGLAAYERLRTGDYLVHIDHGIGRFGGLTEKIIDQHQHEYFMIDYAEDDKLYVPIEHTDRLSRYLGSPHPTLERLSSVHWFQVQKKVKAETSQLASELLSLYAKRHTVELSPWQKSPEEELVAAAFPYPLTADQLKTWAEIETDLSGRLPMDRLICGDVGFGKTELAVRASTRAIFNGYQAAVLAPTTILAQQHFDTFSDRLAGYGIKIGLVSRAQTEKSIKKTLAGLAENKIDLIIGTHRLLTNDVIFHRLGLLVIDEEQRFGVKQKEKIRVLKPAVHVLALSATPIPRTLNLAVASLRDLSIILSPPQGRQAVKMIFGNRQDDLIKTAIGSEISRQGQVYYLVSRIKDLPAAETRIRNLFPPLKVGIIHGRKSPAEVAAVMRQFDNRQLDLLLATSIIENGLDLPNVNTLIVESAEKFGLADLYQLKGRVGRGAVQAFAYFLTAGKKSNLADKRLEALAQTDELGGGLSLALRDLELRGAGAILGREQHGQVSAVGLHLYGQLLAEAITEQQTGQKISAIPEVKLKLPLEGRIAPELVPAEDRRIHLYQRLASVREPTELLPLAEELIGQPLADDQAGRLMKNLLTLLEIKLMAETARLQEITYWPAGQQSKFALRFLETPSPELIERLTKFDDNWHRVESTWQAEHQLAAGAWIPWLKQSLKLLQN